MFSDRKFASEEFARQVVKRCMWCGEVLKELQELIEGSLRSCDHSGAHCAWLHSADQRHG